MQNSPKRATYCTIVASKDIERVSNSAPDAAKLAEQVSSPYKFIIPALLRANFCIQRVIGLSKFSLACGPNIRNIAGSLCRDALHSLLNFRIELAQAFNEQLAPFVGLCLASGCARLLSALNLARLIPGNCVGLRPFADSASGIAKVISSEAVSQRPKLRIGEIA